MFLQLAKHIMSNKIQNLFDLHIKLNINSIYYMAYTQYDIYVIDCRIPS